MVVAIIGILAAVGVVAYQGYTHSASVAAAKANHANLVKWLAAEMTKCDLGQDLRWKSSATGYRTIDCSRTTGNRMMAFLEIHLENSNWKNPYKSSEKAVWVHGGWPTDRYRGRTYLNSNRQRVGNTNTVFLIMRTRFDEGGANRKEDQVACNNCR